jgi:hypothetical protein
MNYERDVALIVRLHLAKLEASLRARHAGLEAIYGVVSGGAVKVFCYLTASWPGRKGDSLVTGIRILEEASGNHLLVTADVCEEDSGFIHLSEPSVTVEVGHWLSLSLMMTIDAMSDHLCRRAVDALIFLDD